MTAKKIPMRKCIGCQEMKPKKELIRVIHSQDGDFCIDSTGKRNGRGAYLCANLDCLYSAMKSKAFARAFQCAIENETMVILQKELEARTNEKA